MRRHFNNRPQGFSQSMSKHFYIHLFYQIPGDPGIIGRGGCLRMPVWIISQVMWKDIFVIAVPLGEKVLRPVLVYLFLVVLLRIFGKRELAQLNPFDLVVLLSLSNTVQNAIIGNDNSLTGGLVGAFTLLGINYLVVRFLFRKDRLEDRYSNQATIET
jgi:hypothetical protein